MNRILIGILFAWFFACGLDADDSWIGEFTTIGDVNGVDIGVERENVLVEFFEERGGEGNVGFLQLETDLNNDGTFITCKLNLTRFTASEGTISGTDCLVNPFPPAVLVFFPSAGTLTKNGDSMTFSLVGETQAIDQEEGTITANTGEAEVSFTGQR